MVVFTGKELAPEQEKQLQELARRVVIKGVESPERLLDETALFLHRAIADLPPHKQQMLERLHRSDEDLKGQQVLVVDDDDVRNIFALGSVLERHGMKVITAQTGHEAISTLEQTTNALLALMCLNAARLPARSDASGDLLPLSEQDRARWNTQLACRGLELFDSSRAGDKLSSYHIEAAIAVAHASAPSFAATDWSAVVGLYDHLMSIAPSPVMALNRAIAVGERDGAARGLAELMATTSVERLRSFPFYPAALGELEQRLGRHDAARRHFQAALALARNEAERRFLQKRLAAASQ